MKKKALITGITGQDGYFLSKLLLNKNYEVIGVCRSFNNEKYDEFIKNFDNITLFECDISNFENINDLIKNNKPDEIYNLAAQTVSVTSFNLQKETFNINAGGVLNILESIKDTNNEIKLLQASSSEVFGRENLEYPQNENTQYNPQTPYAAAKAYADYMIKIYREKLGIYACSAILYNHESFKRGSAYVTSKITKTVANIKKGKDEILYLGNLNAKRDWGHARDYVECMWKILQAPKPDDYVIATGEMHTVREFCEIAFNEIDIELEWKGTGINEKGINKSTGKTLIKVDPKYFRLQDNGILCGNNKKCENELNWQPKTSFNNIIKEMIQKNLKN